MDGFYSVGETCHGPVLDRNRRQLTPTVDIVLDTLRTLTGAQTQQTSVACDCRLFKSNSPAGALLLLLLFLSFRSSYLGLPIDRAFALLLMHHRSTIDRVCDSYKLLKYRYY